MTKVPSKGTIYESVCQKVFILILVFATTVKIVLYAFISILRMRELSLFKARFQVDAYLIALSANQIQTYGNHPNQSTA